MPPGTRSSVTHNRLTPWIAAFTFSIIVSLLDTGFVHGAVSVAVATRTSTQIVLSYTAPDSNPCTIEASESPTYAPPVNDLNPALFAGANVDNRTGSLTSSTSRIVVIGKRKA